MNNCLPKGVKLFSESQLKDVGCGAVEMCIHSDDKQIAVWWYDNKAITFLQSQHRKQPLDSCHRWSAKAKKKVKYRPRLYLSSLLNVLKPSNLMLPVDDKTVLGTPTSTEVVIIPDGSTVFNVCPSVLERISRNIFRVKHSLFDCKR